MAPAPEYMCYGQASSCVYRRTATWAPAQRRDCFLLGRLLESSVAVSSGVYHIYSHHLHSCLHANEAHTRYAHSWDSQVGRVTLYHVASWGSAWQSPYLSVFGIDSSCLTLPRLFLSPFLRGHLLPILGRIAAVPRSRAPPFPTRSMLESRCPPFLSFPRPVPSSAVPHNGAQCPTAPALASTLLPVSPWENLLKMRNCSCVSLPTSPASQILASPSLLGFRGPPPLSLAHPILPQL